MFPILNQELPFKSWQLWEAQIVLIIFDWKSIIHCFFPVRLPLLHYCVSVSSLFHAKSVLLPLPPSSLSCSLYLCWAGKGQGQRISTIYSSKQKQRLLPFNSFAVLFVGFRFSVPGNALPANSSKPISNSSIRQHNKINPGEKTNKQTPFYVTDFGFIIHRRCVPDKTQRIDNEICFDNRIRPL